jgi:serine/threonine protein phosphatase PrpC
VLKALARALRRTEDAYLGVADKMVAEFPELALMGSCVLSMLMKGDDMYVMGVGDSRAVLATMDSVDLGEGSFDGLSPCLSAVQLTSDHSTSMPEVIQFTHINMIQASSSALLFLLVSYLICCLNAGGSQNTE